MSSSRVVLARATVQTVLTGGRCAVAVSVADVLRPDDLVVAVCDNAHEYLGAQAADRLHWSVPDPTRVGSDDAFDAALRDLADRVDRQAPAIHPGDNDDRAVPRAGDGAVAWSGGSEPGNTVNPAAIAAMSERGIDIAGEFPKPWTDEIVRAADVVITMGCGDACPVFPGKRYLDWTLDDPAGQGVDAVRPIRDEIERRVRELLAELDVPVQA